MNKENKIKKIINRDLLIVDLVMLFLLIYFIINIFSDYGLMINYVFLGMILFNILISILIIVINKNYTYVFNRLNIENKIIHFWSYFNADVNTTHTYIEDSKSNNRYIFDSKAVYLTIKLGLCFFLVFIWSLFIKVDSFVIPCISILVYVFLVFFLPRFTAFLIVKKLLKSK